MEFGVKLSAAHSLRSQCLVVPLFETRKLAGVVAELDAIGDKAIGKRIKQGDFRGKLGQTLMLYDVPGISAPRLLLLGCGKARKFEAGAFAKAVAEGVNALKQAEVSNAAWLIETMEVEERDLHWKVCQAVQTADAALYSFDRLKSREDDDAQQPALKKIWWVIADKTHKSEAERACAEGMAIANGVRLARDLGNLPGNICTPTYLAQQAEGFANHYDCIETEVLEEHDMEQLGMGALLSVSRGSRQPAKLILMHYRGAPDDQPPVVLVGKGLTFDAGGISLKPAAAMDEMKYDMCGGASVFGTLRALVDLQLPINVIGVVPSSENLPDGNANKPGDIVTSLSGKTIEILNTDAEGRLILCDALTYVERFEPAAVIDVATLTGACVIALGKHASGLFSNDEALVGELEAAAQFTRDRVWRLPLWDDYQEQLKSNFADMANIGGREAGSITAACFLARFAENYPWAHLDIAGTAWLSGKDKGATGRPVPLLTRLLIERSRSE